MMEFRLEVVEEGKEQNLPRDFGSDTSKPCTSSVTEQYADSNDTRSSEDLPARHSFSTSFRDSKISIAVDISGSTFGDVLAAEKRAIQSICSLIPRNLRATTKILPWNNSAGEPIPSGDLSRLVSDGGTDPNSLIQHPECRYVLQESDFWFLMTDGLIGHEEVRKFARGLLEYALHGKACIISVFGDTDGKPSDCNITVGLSVFAVSPHVAFLFTNVDSGNTFVLQTKGCFSNLLPPGRSNPVLDYNTQWDDLPRTSYENLSRVAIPHSQKVGKEEIILNDNSRLDLTKLLENLPSDDNIIEQIIDNEDNLKSIALTAKIKGKSDRFEAWLDRIDENLDKQDPYITKPPLQEQHSQLLADVIHELEKPVHSEELSSAQKILQEANANDALRMEQDCYREKQGHDRRRSSGHARRVSISGLDDAGDNIGGLQRDYSPVNRYHPDAKLKTGRLRSTGFHKPDSEWEFFHGICNICGIDTSVVAFLLRKPPDEAETLHLPKPDSKSKLLYPLTIGNYPEMDVVSSLLACDSCSYRLVQQGKSFRGDTFISALPIVSFSKNQAPWLEVVNIATQKRFHPFDIPMVFMAILYTKLERLLEEDSSAPFDDMRKAIKWTCNMLLAEVIVSRMHTPELDRFGFGALHEVLLKNFQGAMSDNLNTFLLEYPLDGFIVANIAFSNSKHGQRITGSKRKKIVFFRFLYYLTEQYHQFDQESNKLVTNAAKTLILCLSDPVGPRSLFQWEKLRSLSGHGQNLEEFRKFFSMISRQSRSNRLSISIKELTETPFLTVEAMNQFQRLGVLFNWISSQAGHATAAFLHHLLRTDVAGASTQEHFVKIAGSSVLKQALDKPETLSARGVEDLISKLPPLL
ncbi:MAG: hypothetical protein Q9190_000292 [Brigantiaea leucoxantha]